VRPGAVIVMLLVVAAQFAPPLSIAAGPVWLKFSIIAEARNVPLKTQL